jgi:heat shock protein HslJ
MRRESIRTVRGSDAGLRETAGRCQEAVTQKAGQVIALVLLTLVLAACSTASPDRHKPPSSLLTQSESTGAELIGLWRVQAAGEGRSSYAIVTAGAIAVERNQDLITAAWDAGGHQINAAITAWQGPPQNEDVEWLTAARSFRSNGRNRLLVSGDGIVLATLSPARSAPAPRSASPELVEPPTLSPQDRITLSAPSWAPSRGEALHGNQLVGRWEAGIVPGPHGVPYLELQSDGSYTSADGCNGWAGTWRLINGNRLLVTTGTVAGVGCGSVADVPGWVAHAEYATLEAGQLILFDRHGNTLGQLHKAPPRNLH